MQQEVDLSPVIRIWEGNLRDPHGACGSPGREEATFFLLPRATCNAFYHTRSIQVITNARTHLSKIALQ